MQWVNVAIRDDKSSVCDCLWEVRVAEFSVTFMTSNTSVWPNFSSFDLNFWCSSDDRTEGFSSELRMPLMRCILQSNPWPVATISLDLSKKDGIVNHLSPDFQLLCWRRNWATRQLEMFTYQMKPFRILAFVRSCPITLWCCWDCNSIVTLNSKSNARSTVAQQVAHAQRTAVCEFGRSRARVSRLKRVYLQRWAVLFHKTP